MVIAKEKWAMSENLFMNLFFAMFKSFEKKVKYVNKNDLSLKQKLHTGYL